MAGFLFKERNMSHPVPTYVTKYYFIKHVLQLQITEDREKAMDLH